MPGKTTRVNTRAPKPSPRTMPSMPWPNRRPVGFPLSIQELIEKAIARRVKR